MNRLLPLLLVVASLVTGCKRETDLGFRTLEVRVILFDDINSPGTHEPRKGVEVFVSEAGVTNSYLRKALTDSAGRCVFENLVNEAYIVYSRSIDSSVQYYAQADVDKDASFVELTLLAEGTTQSGLLLYVRDANGQPVQNASVAWAVDPALVAGNIIPPAGQTGTTNAYGRYVLLNKPPGDYFFRVRNDNGLQEGRITLTAVDDIFVRDTLTLQPGSGNGCIITCLDQQSSGLQGLRVDLYTSQFDALTNDTANSAYNGYTNNLGKVTLAPVDPRSYFITIQSADQGVLYSGEIVVVASVVTQVTYPLTPTLPSELRLTCVDQQGNGVSNLEVNLYTTRVLADSNDVQLRTYQAMTNVLGIATYVPVTPRWYYIGIEQTTLGIDKVDSVQVIGTGLTQHTTYLFQ